MHILVTSPIPSHPQNHGNRARVTALCRALQAQGAEIHYVYGGLEELPDKHELAMREAWDHVHILPPRRSHEKKQSHKNHHLIDDWYVEAVTDVTQRILRTWAIDYCIANYVWFSRWLEHVPAGIPKYIDTHDVFANRHQRLAADGLEASWFSTTPAEEARGMARADIVLAIQSEEAKTFRATSNTDVMTLGHFIEPDFLEPSKTSHDRKVTIGYLSSDNPINQQSLRDMDKALKSRPELLEKYDFVLAGAICNSPAAAATAFRKLGFVENARAFYQATDIIINPNVGGTGLKIKSIEALAHGKALVATQDAMAGINSDRQAHSLAGAAEIADYLMMTDPAHIIGEGEKAARAVASQYVDDQKHALQHLFPRLFAGQSTQAGEDTA